MVVDEIRAAGGKAVANYDSVENGDRIIDTAIKEFGGIHVLLNNAGILRDVSFKNMKDDDWDLVIKVHIKGAYKVNLSRDPWNDWLSDRISIVVCKSRMASFQEAKVRPGYQHCFCCRSIW